MFEKNEGYVGAYKTASPPLPLGLKMWWVLKTSSLNFIKEIFLVFIDQKYGVDYKCYLRGMWAAHKIQSRRVL